MKEYGYRPSTKHIRQLLQSGGKQDFSSAAELALRHVLISVHVEENFDRLIEKVKQERWFQHLETTWEVLKPTVRAREWKRVMSHLVESAYSSRPYCVRCGECCLHGSPSLHVEDLPLIDKGIFSPQDLYTLRKGERVRLNLEGQVGVAEQEVIKIKEKSENGQCIFYRERNRECAIYEHRPLQCQLQACWDPEPLKQLLDQEKLTRRHVFKDDEAILKMIQAHDERCFPEQLDAAFRKIGQSDDETALNQVLAMLRYDMAFRTVLKEKGGMQEKELDFFFGRPLQKIVQAYGVRVNQDENGIYQLVSDG
jgi:Fe-S-cluster containining protein